MVQSRGGNEAGNMGEVEAVDDDELDEDEEADMVRGYGADK
jgi:hypothetical protein